MSTLCLTRDTHRLWLNMLTVFDSISLLSFTKCTHCLSRNTLTDSKYLLSMTQYFSYLWFTIFSFWLNIDCLYSLSLTRYPQWQGLNVSTVNIFTFRFNIHCLWPNMLALFDSISSLYMTQYAHSHAPSPPWLSLWLSRLTLGCADAQSSDELSAVKMNLPECSNHCSFCFDSTYMGVHSQSATQNTWVQCKHINHNGIPSDGATDMCLCVSVLCVCFCVNLCASWWMWSCVYECVPYAHVCMCVVRVFVVLLLLTVQTVRNHWTGVSKLWIPETSAMLAVHML